MAKRRLPSNWRRRIKIVADKEYRNVLTGYKKEIRYVLTFIEGKTPKGFLTIIGDIVVSIKNDGEIQVEPELNEWAKGRGLGKMLYEHVLNKYGSISTIYHDASPEAQMVWDSLCRRFPYKTDSFSGKLEVSKPKTSRK